MFPFLHSVRLRLTLWYAGVLALVLTLFAIAVYVFVVRTLQTELDTALQRYGTQIDQAASRHVKGKGLDVKGVPVPTLTAHDPIAAFVVMSIGGQHKAVVKKGHPKPDYAELRISIRQDRQNCGPLPLARAQAQLGPLHYCTRLVYKGGKPVGGIEVVESLAGVDKTLDRLRLALLLGVPFALLLAGGGGWLLAGRALEPVDRITRLARSITATDLTKRINLERQDELGRLAGTFDDMIDRLERAFQEQRQLTADVSHELRSPLTVLEAQTTLALRRQRSAEEYRHVLASTQEEIERMSTMVNQLLTLARADAGEEQINLEPVALDALTRTVVDGMDPLAQEGGLALTFRASAPVWVEGDPGRLRQLVINLLDNAMRHTPPGGRVDITIARRGNWAILRVADTGDGISSEDLPHIFQRFYRGDRARSRVMGNSGLGLAIVKWIVEAHGGHIHVSSSPGEGSAFTVTLPATLGRLAAPPLLQARV